MAKDGSRSQSKFELFKQFCSKTTLHGWAYLSEYPMNSWQGIFWLAVIVPVYILATILVVTYTDQYINAGIQTSSGTKDIQTSLLGEVYFPSLTVCNINQMEMSFLKINGIADNYTQAAALYAEYITGRFVHEDHEQILRDIEWLQDKDLRYKKSFNEYSTQSCRDMVVYLRYQDKEAYFGELDVKFSAITDATDYGFCCLIIPQIALNNNSAVKEAAAEDGSDPKLSRELFHTAIGVGSKIGEDNGLRVILDIENFDFAYHRVASQGLKVAVHDHRSKPFMEHDSLLVPAGRKTQISTMPMITVTTEAAVDKLRPGKRDCYVDGEAHLRYFEWEMGYFYNLNNCFFNYALHRIIKECKCRPFFMPDTSSQKNNSRLRKMGVASVRLHPYCTGAALKCMHDIVGDIEGEGGVAHVIPRLGEDVVDMEEEDWEDEKKRLAQEGMVCLPRCSLQQNVMQTSSAIFPQQRNFHLQKTFCYLALKILGTTCDQNETESVLDTTGHQGLCSALREHSYLFHDCPNWPASLILPGSDFERVKYRAMMDSLQSYAMENLAELALTVRSPSVHVVKRDLSMTLVSFVGSLGGLLGLCLGFSFISFIEFFYHVVITRLAGTLGVCCKNNRGGSRNNSDAIGERGSRRRKHSTNA